MPCRWPIWCGWRGTRFMSRRSRTSLWQERSGRSSILLPAVECGVDRHSKGSGKLVGLGGQRNDGEQLAMLLLRHSLGAGSRGMGMDAIAAAIGGRNGDVDHLLGQRVDGAFLPHDG